MSTAVLQRHALLERMSPAVGPDVIGMERIKVETAAPSRVEERQTHTIDAPPTD